MQTLLAIVYPSEAQARATLETVGRAQSSYLASLEDACIVTRDENGNAKLHQLVNTTAAAASAASSGAA